MATYPVSLPQLPITEVLDRIGDALTNGNRAILSAPPGAGKTTLVPLSLLNAPWRNGGKIIVLEPRRLAARAAARRMAFLLGEDPGGRVGYRMRLDSRIGRDTVIEVVTEGVFARMIIDDPELSGIAAVLFDEFHERSLDADFGLALALDAQGALRDDLRLLVMSATLDVQRIAALLEGAPVIESQGRSFPVDVRYRARTGDERIEDAMAAAILNAHAQETGSILAFLPGQGEILRTAERLEGRFDANTLVMPLYGNLEQRDQDAAIRPAHAGTRKIVLATSIAETSITIDGVRVVIDSGLQRQPVFEPATGITRLETVRVSKASADQRAGRAGRTEPGIAIRIWHSGQTAALSPFSPPQILASDLSSFALDLAGWGVEDPGALAFIDPPPAAALKEARSLLQLLGALDESNQLTAAGRTMRELELSPRLAAMVIAAASDGHALAACEIAVLLGEQGLGGNSVDIEERLRRFRNERGPRAVSARKLAERMARPFASSAGQPVTPGALLLHAYPDRVALQRGGRGRFVLANGRGAELPETDRLAGASMLVVADLTGRAQSPRILAAAEVDRKQIEAGFPDLIRREDQAFFDPASRQVRGRRVTRLGAIILDESPLPRPTGEAAARGLAEGVRQLGMAALPFGKEVIQIRDRIAFLKKSGDDSFPAMDDEALLAGLEDWFIPFQTGITSFDGISSGNLAKGILSLVPYEKKGELERLVPTHFTAPTGQSHAIRYDGEEPVLSIRVQELFGLTAHPTIGGGRIPLLLELLSPAHRLIQTTRDLPGFWAGSWRDVRADMRGRYPKHVWPENPAEALPTTRAKPRAK